MAIQPKNKMTSVIASKTNKEGRVESRPVTTEQTDDIEAMVAMRVRQLMTKQSRTLQRSLRIDKRMADWLDNVKKHQKEVMGIPRPCLDDLMYDAITEYLNNHYKELEP